MWIALAAVVIASVWLVTARGDSSLGEILAVVMYVFEFSTSVMAFPLHYQQLVRLREIAERLGSAESVAPA